MASLGPYSLGQADGAVTSAGNHADPEATRPRPAALHPRVLESVEVKFPDHSVFYQRVAPPVAPAARAPVALPVVKSLSLAESAAAEARAQKKSVVLMLSATVYDRQVTELRWSANGRAYRAWSNADFNLLAGQGEVETEDAVYSLLMALGNETREAAAEGERQATAHGLADSWETKTVPDLSKFPVGRSTYLPSGDVPDADSLAALEALHRYYDAQHLRLVADYEKRQAANTAREQWLKDHPPKPENTVINFWPIKSRTYPTGQ